MKALGWFAWLLCAGCAGAQSSKPECADLRLGMIVAECKIRVETECKTVENCPAIHECDRMIDKWEACQ